MRSRWPPPPSSRGRIGCCSVPAGVGQLDGEPARRPTRLSRDDLAVADRVARSRRRSTGPPVGAALARDLRSSSILVIRSVRRPKPRPSRSARRPARPGSGRSPPPARPRNTPRARFAANMSPRSALMSAILRPGELDGAPRGAADHHRLGVLLGAQQGVRERLDGIATAAVSIADAIGIGGCRAVPVGILVAMSRTVRASVRPAPRRSAGCRWPAAAGPARSVPGRPTRMQLSSTGWPVPRRTRPPPANRPCSRAVRSQPAACSIGQGALIPLGDRRQHVDQAVGQRGHRPGGAAET